MPNTHTQTISRNLLLQTYICAAELATWHVGLDLTIPARIIGELHLYLLLAA